MFLPLSRQITYFITETQTDLIRTSLWIILILHYCKPFEMPKRTASLLLHPPTLLIGGVRNKSSKMKITLGHSQLSENAFILYLQKVMFNSTIVTGVNIIIQLYSTFWPTLIKKKKDKGICLWLNEVCKYFPLGRRQNKKKAELFLVPWRSQVTSSFK